MPTVERSFDASFYSDTSETATGPDTSTSILAMDQGLDQDGRLSDDIVQLPSVPSRAETAGPYNSPSFIKRTVRQSKAAIDNLSICAERLNAGEEV